MKSRRANLEPVDRDDPLTARAGRHLVHGVSWLDALTLAVDEPAPRSRATAARRAARTRGPRAAGLAPGTGTPGRTTRTLGQVRRSAIATTAIDRDDAAAALGALGGGGALPTGLRRELEAALGADLGAVRIHTDAAAAHAADTLGARGFAVGLDLGFATGAYDPDSVEGRRLIAHEVAHTLQPGAGAGLTIGAPDSADERAADAFAEQFVTGRPAARPTPGTAVQTATPVRRWAAPGGARRLNDGDHRASSGTTRYALEGLHTIQLREPRRHPDTAETVTGGGGGRAIAVVPSRFRGPAAFDVMVHFHGNNVGYRETSQLHHAQAQGTVRDEELDRIEPQVEASGRNLIAIMPQGTTPPNGALGLSAFGISSLDAFVAEVLGRLPGVEVARLRRTIVSAHSGGGNSAMAHVGPGGGESGRMRPLFLFEAVNNDSEVARVGQWIEASLATDLRLLSGLPDAAARLTWLRSHGAQLVANYNPQRHYVDEYTQGQRPRRGPRPPGGGERPVLLDASGHPIMEPFRGLQRYRDDWFTTHRTELTRLGAGVADALRGHYVIQTTGNRHDQILRGNLGRAIDHVDGERIPTTP